MKELFSPSLSDFLKRNLEAPFSPRLYFKEYDVDLEKLSYAELKVVRDLTESLVKLENHYVFLKSQSFYPLATNEDERAVLRTRIEQLSVDEPLFKSHYTVIESDPKTRAIKAVPFHQKFARQHKELASSIGKASEIAGLDPLLKEHLKNIKTAIETDSYEQAEIAWLEQSRPTRVDLIFKPAESYGDKFMERYYDWEGVLGILNESVTNEVSKFKDQLLSVQRKKKPDPKVTVKVWDVKAAAGLVVENGFSASTFPNDWEIAQSHGSVIIIFKQMMDENFNTKLLPIIKQAFAPSSFVDLDES